MKRKNNGRSIAAKKERDPRKRVYLLLSEASDAIMRSNVEQAKLLCLQSVIESKRSKMKDLLTESLAMTGRCFLYSGDRTKSINYFKKVIRKYEQMGDIDGILEMQYLLATANVTTGNERDTILHLHQILHTWISESTQTATAQQRGERFFISRLWKDRILNHTPSPLQSKKNHQLKIKSLYNALTHAYVVIGEYQKALPYMEKELSLAKSLKSPDGIAKTLINLGEVYTLMGKKALALEYLLQASKLFGVLRDEASIAGTQENLATLYFQTGQVNLGKRLSKKAFLIYNKLKLWDSASRTLIMLAEYERLHGSIVKASRINSQALRLLKKNDKGEAFFKAAFQQLLIQHVRILSRNTYVKLVHLHTETSKKKIELRFDIASEIVRIAEELHLYPDSLRWLKKVHEYEIERKNILQKKEIANILMDQKLERISQEREFEKLKAEKLESELKAKAHETELLVVQLAKKGSVLADLKDRLDIMRCSKTIYSAETITAVIELIESLQFKDKEYEQLEERAKALHHDFFVLLSNKFPALTEREKRVCVLLKLGLKPVDIASVLFTSARTVETHCLSIRKKMQLPRKVRLLLYLQGL